MAGLYSRISRDTASNERIAANLIHAAFVLRSAGKYNDLQIRNGLDTFLTRRGGTILSGDELTDLSNIASIMDSKNSASQKLIYAEVLRAAMIAVEQRLMDENQFNTAVELSA